MTADAAHQKKRLIAMLAIDVVCFLLAGAAIVGHVALGLFWLLPAFLVAIFVGLGAQIWFILGWARASRGGEGELS